MITWDLDITELFRTEEHPYENYTRDTKWPTQSPDFRMMKDETCLVDFEPTQRSAPQLGRDAPKASMPNGKPPPAVAVAERAPPPPPPPAPSKQWYQIHI